MRHLPRDAEAVLEPSARPGLAAVGLEDMLLDADQDKVDRVMAALLEMGKLDIAELEQAAAA